MILDDLQEAIEVRKKYNEMPFKEFVKLVEERIGKKFPKKEIRDWRFCGLSHVCFFEMFGKDEEEECKK